MKPGLFFFDFSPDPIDSFIALLHIITRTRVRRDSRLFQAAAE
jgi:hypothetical protein